MSRYPPNSSSTYSTTTSSTSKHPLRDFADMARNQIQKVYETFHRHAAASGGSRTCPRTGGGGPCTYPPFTDKNHELFEEDYHHHHPQNGATAQKVTQVMEQVFQTLFAPCVPLNPHTNHTRSYNQGNIHNNTATTDAYYAPFFHSSTTHPTEKDDADGGGGRGQTARAILLARQQEELERQLQRFDDENYYAPQQGHNMWQRGKVPSTSLLAKNIHIPVSSSHPDLVSNMNRTRMYEEDYGFDDGVSALSAHTLEDMARLHMRLEEAVSRKKEGGHGIHIKATMMMNPPLSELHQQQEDYYISQQQGNGGEGGDPPSPASTENSEDSPQKQQQEQQHVVYKHHRNTSHPTPTPNDNKSNNQSRRIMTSTTTPFLQTDVEDWLNVGQHHHHHHSLPVVTSQSQPVIPITSSSSSSFELQQQQQQPRGVTSSADKMISRGNAKTSSQSFIHPHDTLMSISAQDVVPKRSKKISNTTSSLYRRKLEYQTAEI